MQDAPTAATPCPPAGLLKRADSCVCIARESDQYSLVVVLGGALWWLWKGRTEAADDQDRGLPVSHGGEFVRTKQGGRGARQLSAKSGVTYSPNIRCSASNESVTSLGDVDVSIIAAGQVCSARARDEISYLASVGNIPTDSIGRWRNVSLKKMLELDGNCTAVFGLVSDHLPAQ